VGVSGTRKVNVKNEDGSRDLSQKPSAVGTKAVELIYQRLRKTRSVRMKKSCLRGLFTDAALSSKRVFKEQ